MDTNILAWLFAAILLFIAVLLAADFIRGWRAGRSATKKEATQDAEGTVAPVSKLDTVKDAGIDLMGVPRPTFAVTLPPDGKCLHLRTPTKAVADRFAQLGEMLERMGKGRHTLDDIEQLYLLTSMLLANNTDGTLMTVADARERMTTDDVVGFLTAYMEWLTDIIKSKN